jgi:hypothetical protein
MRVTRFYKRPQQPPKPAHITITLHPTLLQATGESKRLDKLEREHHLARVYPLGHRAL